MKASLNYEELTNEQKLKHFWQLFCDADPVPESFLDDMESAGYVDFKIVTKSDYASISCPEERGIRVGGYMVVLTKSGEEAYGK